VTLLKGRIFPVNNKRHDEHPGFLFALEGIDGAGKTAVVDSLVELLSLNYDVVRLREPTNESQWGLEIRERSPSGALTPDEELELFHRDRQWHVENRIRPALEAGKLVLMDRYFFASGAYQSVSTGIPWKEILRRNRVEIGAPEPNIIFILDVSVEVGLERALQRNGTKNEQFEQVDRLIKVREAYLAMTQEDDGMYVIVDAAKTLEEVTSEVYSEIVRYVKHRE
jgi:dTMP kinase